MVSLINKAIPVSILLIAIVWISIVMSLWIYEGPRRLLVKGFNKWCR